MWDYVFLPQSNNAIRVAVNQLIKSILFLSIRDTWDVGDSTHLYVRYIAQIYGQPQSQKEIIGFQSILTKHFKKPREPITFR